MAVSVRALVGARLRAWRGEDASSPVDVGRLARQLLYRFRAQLAPWVLLLVGLLGGLLVSGQGLGVGLAVSTLVAGVTGWYVRGALRTRPRVRPEVGACVVLAVGWLLAVSLFGFTAVDWLGVLCWLGPSLEWLRRHRRSSRGGSAESSGALVVAGGVEESVGVVVSERVLTGTESSVAVARSRGAARMEPRDRSSIALTLSDGELSQVQQRWNARLRDRRDALSGTLLSAPEYFEHGESYTLQLVPGLQHLGQIIAELPWISTGLEYDMEDLVIEKHPDYRNPTILRMQVVTKSPIRETVYFQSPVVDDGRIRIGPYSDGCGYASYRLYADNGIYGGFFLGSLRSGKSRTIELVALSALRTGTTLVFYIDGQNGASSPLLYREATWAGGPSESDDMLAALERALYRRQLYNRVYELPGFVPSPEYSGILVVVDECHRVFNRDNGERWGNVAREGSKVGVAVVGASQYSGLRGTFGGVDALRSSMFAGNSFVLRTSSRGPRQMVPGLEDLNPSKLPALPGYGYMLVPAEDQVGRSAPYRAEYIPDERDRVEGGALPVPTVEEWFTRSREERWAPEVDAMTAQALGSDFIDRQAIAARRRAAVVAEFESGVYADLVLAPVPTASSAVSSLGSESEVPPRRCADAILALSWPEDGVLKREDILEQLPSEFRNPSTVASALRSLLDQGMLVSVGPGRGIYQRVVVEGTAG